MSDATVQDLSRLVHMHPRNSYVRNVGIIRITTIDNYPPYIKYMGE